MSTAAAPSPSSFSIPLFTQLVHRLRHTNARYNLIAYQCRRAYRPTNHAKRRASRAGLRIDTSKTCSLSPTSVFISDTSIGHLTERKGADRDREVAEGGGLPEAVVPKCLSPLDLEIRFADGDWLFRGGVPGAPRLRPRALPDADEYRTERVPELSLGCTQCDEVGLGITIPERRLKRKLRDIDG